MMTTSGFRGPTLILVDEAGSTNNYATALLQTKQVKEGTVIWTFRQTRGRGQGTAVWESQDYRNLTFSLILFPRFLSAADQFLLSQVVSLGLAGFLDQETGGVAIKWPNDLLVNRKKIAGILIENTLAGESLHSSVIGVGLNLNQLHFPSHLPNATSLSLVTGRNHPPEESLKLLIEKIRHWYDLLIQGKSEEIRRCYLSRLSGMNTLSKFKTDTAEFEATVRGIDRFGRLLLEDKEGNVSVYSFKSVEMIL